MPANRENAVSHPAQAAGAQPLSILVFRIGSLGDTLVSIPSFWAVRENFPDAKITLLCDQHIGKRYVLSADVLRGSGLIDDFLAYPAGGRGPMQLLRMATLLWRLRRRHFQTLVYLAPSARESSRVKRDRSFFQLAGIQNLIGMMNWTSIRALRTPGQPLTELPREADLLLQRLSGEGLHVPPPGQGKMELGIGAAEQAEVDRWVVNLPSSEGRPWIAVAPGSKMPAKIWPHERYMEVVSRLIERFDVWPVVVGGAEDRPIAEVLLKSWKRGYSAAGALGLRPSAAAMARCRLYLGNDTGSMHLAVAVGVPCVAIFSSRAEPGLWYPYGQGHHVFRTAIDCEGCELQVCIERKMECIRRIGVDEVVEACAQALAKHDAPASGIAR